jgi:DNA-binding CsgD family transcriptional regulator
MSIKPLILKLSNPHVMAALRDFRSMQRWEVLRSSHRAMSARELADACSSSYEETVASIDRLIDGGFVLRRKATAKCRHATFRSAAESIIVAFDASQEAQREWINSQRREVRRCSREAMDSYFSGVRPPGARKRYAELYRAPRLDAADVGRVSEILQRAFDAILEIERESEARAHRSAIDGGSPAGEPRSQYIVALQSVAVGAGVLPLPSINLMEAALVPGRCSTLLASPKVLLTARELEVAERLASGESRPAAAKSLGVSANTIASTTKRIYSKLGVSNRAEFVSRMSTLAGR